MASEISATARHQLDIFCRQYLQIQLRLDYPAREHLRHDGFQRALYAKLFQDGAVEHAPPLRYQSRVLKELIKRIEESIEDWEEDVRASPADIVVIESLHIMF